MPLNEEQVKFLDGLGKDYIHAKNILAKKNKAHIEKFFDAYVEFHENQSKPLIEGVKALNQYKNFVEKNNRKEDNKMHFPIQSKFESTILEEFICQILKTRFGNDVLMYGSVKAYSSLYFSYPSKDAFKQGVDIKINVKDQDVGIYKKEAVKIADGKRHEIYIPMVCIECKTYLDKTMYEGSVATASKIKNGNPQCLFFIATETYDVSSNVGIETTQIDNIYVLRKQRRRNEERDKMHVDVFQKMLDAISTRIERTNKSVDDMIKEGHLRA